MLIYLRAFGQRDQDNLDSSVDVRRRPWSTRYRSPATDGTDAFTPYDSKSIPQILVQVRTELTTTDQRGLGSLSDSAK